MTITTTIELRAVVTVVESPGQTGARQADGAPLEPSLEREARIESVELPDAEGAGLRWRKGIPTKPGFYFVRPWKQQSEITAMEVWHEDGKLVALHRGYIGGLKEMLIQLPKRTEFLGPIQPNVATPAHLPVESLSPTDAQRIMRLSERQLSEPNDQTYE